MRKQFKGIIVIGAVLVAGGLFYAKQADVCFSCAWQEAREAANEAAREAAEAPKPEPKAAPKPKREDLLSDRYFSAAHDDVKRFWHKDVLFLRLEFERKNRGRYQTAGYGPVVWLNIRKQRDQDYRLILFAVDQYNGCTAGNSCDRVEIRNGSDGAPVEISTRQKFAAGEDVLLYGVDGESRALTLENRRVLRLRLDEVRIERLEAGLARPHLQIRIGEQWLPVSPDYRIALNQTILDYRRLLDAAAGDITAASLDAPIIPFQDNFNWDPFRHPGKWS